MHTRSRRWAAVEIMLPVQKLIVPSRQSPIRAAKANQAADSLAARIASQVESGREVRGEAAVVDTTGTHDSMRHHPSPESVNLWCCYEVT